MSTSALDKHRVGRATCIQHIRNFTYVFFFVIYRKSY